ncbi:PREDICTED: CENPB DNA-binding domain-containing protein 1-like [Gavialis gangeticus]|uniref:CENPB DNA-binding domain-containing protein 1-like n=1 Tax=Gavialis gangeticus TaxID=94835 RepID=UPI00092E732F|nr:PREDICTED: CENPB DNA-binding domain-containing protein 1-like [Gavialis gangeticus]
MYYDVLFNFTITYSRPLFYAYSTYRSLMFMQMNINTQAEKYTPRHAAFMYIREMLDWSYAQPGFPSRILDLGFSLNVAIVFKMSASNSDSISASVFTRKRKAITLEEKLEVVKRYKRGEKTKEIRCATGLSESTLHTIRDNVEKIKKSHKSATRLSTASVSLTRSAVMEKMEHMLTTWIEHQNQEHVPLSTQVVQTKPRSIYEVLNHDDPEAKPFNASARWFDRYKACHGFHNLKLMGEAAAADKSAADKSPSILQATIEEESYDMRQVFNLDKTGLFWKWMPSQTFISV